MADPELAPSDLDEEIERAVELVTRAVEASRTRSLPGADLGNLLRREHKELLGRIGVKVTPFLDRYAPRLTVVGRTGDDLLWGLDRADDAPWVDMDTVLVEEDLPRKKARNPESVSLQRVRFENYRSVGNTVLELAPLTVLVGANGAGKSNLLDGVFRAVQLTHQKPASVFDGPHAVERVARRGGRKGFALTLEGTQNWSLRFDPSGESQHQFSVHEGSKTELTHASLLLTQFKKAFGPAMRLNLSAPTLAQPTFFDDVEPYLREDGLYLPTVLNHLAGFDREALQEIIRHVRELVPQVEDLRTPRHKVGVTVNQVLTIDGQEVKRTVHRDEIGHALEVKMGGYWTPADQLSEGTLLAIGLHTLFTSRKRGNKVQAKVVLIDDVDRGLHPNAQRLLMKQLQTLASDQLRIIVTSHSPFVLDPVPPQAVRVVQLDEGGGTILRNLTDHPAWPKWDGAMTAAEFWQYAGDAWVPEEP